MDYLPVVVGRNQPFLEAVSHPQGSNRSICPRGRLVALVTPGGEIAVHSLVREHGDVIAAAGPFSR